MDDSQRSDGPHDVLAAEEFPLGSGDPALHVEHAHDVLAAEEFPVGSGDAALHLEHLGHTDSAAAAGKRGARRAVAVGVGVGLMLAFAVAAALAGALRRRQTPR